MPTANGRLTRPIPKDILWVMAKEKIIVPFTADQLVFIDQQAKAIGVNRQEFIRRLVDERRGLIMMPSVPAVPQPPKKK